MSEERPHESVSSVGDKISRFVEQAIAQAEAALESRYKVRLEKAVELAREEIRDEISAHLRQEYEMEQKARAARFEKVRMEIERVGEILDAVAAEIEKMIEDPDTELSRVMRKKNEQTELKAYLNGLKYSLGLREES